MIIKHEHFALTNFEGTLDFLLCLIQKEEIDIYDVPIQELIQQFIHKLTNCQEEGLEKGAEFIGTAAYLVWLKSKTLLPCKEEPSDLEAVIEDPHFEIIHHLIDYCRFKQAAKDLASMQEKQQACYFRGVDVPEWKKPLGIDHVSLEELSQLFKEMIGRAALVTTQIQEENWRVSDKMRHIRRKLQEDSSFPLAVLLSSQQSRPEIIVIFLAILELMKIGELAVGREQASATLMIFAKRNKET
jgi:segregation and condensation protein A